MPAGISLALFDTFGFLGIETTLGANGSRTDQVRTDQVRTNRFSASIGVNFATPIDLYPGVAISAEHTRRSSGEALVENRTLWGLDVKLSAIGYPPVGITVGYRAPFEEPLGGSAILGISLLLLRQE